MGIDFITVCTKHFQKSWDRGRRELAEPTLFTDVPKGQKQTFLAFPRQPGQIIAGRQYEISIEGEKVLLIDGIDVIAEFVGMPQSAMTRIRDVGFGCAVGHVHRVHDLSGAADVTIR
jgi:hypothetical protein